MKVLGLLGLLALVSVTVVEGQMECTDGSVWFRDCNRCWCIQGRAACTLKGCPKQLSGRGPRCVDGSRWMQDGCNWCNCLNGVGVCTRRACLPKWAAGRSIDAAEEAAPAADAVAISAVAAPFAAAPESEPECEATGGRWRVGCNWCRCSETGRGLCTKRACPPLIIEKLKDTPVCEDGARWRQDCNWCSCEEGRAVCTEKACLSEQEPDNNESRVQTRKGIGAYDTGDRVSCEAASTADRWRHNCNWCRCIDGLSACTKRGCPPSLRSRLEGTPECEGTVRWKKDNCNWCSCQNGIAACTLKACINREDYPQVPEEPPAQEYEPDCVGTSRWTESCNQCQCVEGVKICTLKGCLTEVEDTCEEGSVWKRDCNWCSCKGGNPVCSKRACRPVTGEEQVPSPGTCVEGTSWKDDCNTCSCVNGHAVCTLIACLGVVRPEVIPDPSQPQIEERPRDQNRPAVIPDPTRPQIEERPRNQNRPAVIPDPTRPQIEERPRDQNRPAVVPDPTAPQVSRRARTAVSLPVDNRDCLPGSRFSIDGCNWCTCSSTGIAACTLKACFKRMERVCEEGARWKQDCNWCDCEGGEAKCTQLACFDAVVREPVPSSRALEEASIASTGPDVRCKPGSRWSHACSSCSCTDDGEIECEAAACPPGVDASDFEDTCSEGAEWKQACAVCSCGEDGKPLCSSSSCGDAASDEADSSESRNDFLECRPGSTFKESCNSCRCSTTGRKLCTKKICRPGFAPPPGPQCSPGSLFLDSRNCNWCFCDDGAIVCGRSDECESAKAQGSDEADVSTGTDVTTSEEGPADEQSCDEGTTWMQDCNRCRCINGAALCDRRACIAIPKSDSVSESDSETNADLESNASSPTRRCLKPVDSGPCFASFRRFRFNAEKNRCEGFLYGGCGGNDNNFLTADDCQQTCGGDAPVIDASCDRRQCPNFREVAYMQAKGCTPEYKDASCCPTSYKCTEPPASDPESCTYNGTTYATGENVPVRNPCLRCRCGDGPSKGEFNCVSVECPSLFQPRDPKCRRLYKLDQCCSYDTECEDDGPSGTSTRSDAITCELESRTYKAGDKMDFEDAPCQRCVCGANYTGPYGEGCAPIDCGYDSRVLSRIRRGCVPRFYKNRCCPISYICPGDRQTQIDQSQANPEGDMENVCTFGDVTVALGRELATTEAKIKCTCLTPPTITCVENPVQVAPLHPLVI